MNLACTNFVSVLPTAHIEEISNRHLANCCQYRIVWVQWLGTSTTERGHCSRSYNFNYLTAYCSVQASDNSAPLKKIAFSHKRKNEQNFTSVVTISDQMCYLCLNSWNGTLLGKPLRQIRMPSKTPLHRS